MIPYTSLYHIMFISMETLELSYVRIPLVYIYIYIYIFRRKMGGSPKVMRFGIRANAVVTNVHNKPYVTFNGKSLDMVSSLGLPN